MTCANHNLRAGRAGIGDIIGDWHFSGGPWTEASDGTVAPPAANGEFFHAFDIGRSFSDVTVECAVRPGYRDNGLGSGGVILRAGDPRRWYIAYIPWCGQQTRAKHFWAAIGISDGSGYIKNLAMELVHDVEVAPSSTSTRWIDLKVTATGEEIRMWIDGRPGPVVRDARLKSGRVGVGGQGEFAFRDVRIDGSEIGAPAWNTASALPENWTIPAPTLTGGQVPRPMVRLRSGEILLSLYSFAEQRTYLLRSHDQGRSWSEPVAAPFAGSCTPHMRRDGQLIMTRSQKDAPDQALEIAESSDDGKTWSALRPCQSENRWAAPAGLRANVKLTPSNLFDTPSGALIAYRCGRHESDGGAVGDWGRTHVIGYSLRSADGGSTWDAPAPLDGPPSSQHHSGALCFLDQTASHSRLL